MSFVPRWRRSAWNDSPMGVIRLTLKRAYNDGTLAVDMDPLSLLCRLRTAPTDDDGDSDGDDDGDERHARPDDDAHLDDDARRHDGETRESLSLVDGASQADLRGRCARVFELSRSDEARRNTDGADERHTLPRGGRRAHRRAGSLTEPWVALLEEHDPRAEGSR